MEEREDTSGVQKSNLRPKSKVRLSVFTMFLLKDRMTDFRILFISDCRYCISLVQLLLHYERSVTYRSFVAFWFFSWQDCGLTVKGVTAKWSEATEEDTLSNVSCAVKAGELLAVIGPVGSGKVRSVFQCTASNCQQANFFFFFKFSYNYRSVMYKKRNYFTVIVFECVFRVGSVWFVMKIFFF